MAPLIIIAIILFGLILLIWNKLRYDIIALVMLSVALLFKVVKYEDAYLGFMNPAVISVGCIMIISRSLIQSNILYIFIEKTSKYMKSQTAHVALLVSLTTFFSMFMNNVGALSLVLPIAIKTADDLKHSRSSILMPIAFGAGLGGLCTSFGTPPNLIIANFRKQAEMIPFSVFDFAPVGVSIAIVGVLFLVIFGWRIVNQNRGSSSLLNAPVYLCEIVIKNRSPLIGKKIGELKENPNFFYPIKAVCKNGAVITNLDYQLKRGDEVLLETKIGDLETLIHKYKTHFRLIDQKKKEEYQLVEAVVAKSSKVIGKLLKDINLSKKFDFNIIGIKKSAGEINQEAVEAGDMVIIATKKSLLLKHLQALGLLTLTHLEPIKEIRFKNFLPLIFFSISITLNTLRILPLHIALSFATLLIVLTNCLPTHLLYESISWPVIILLGAMIPLATSFQTSGGAEMISQLFLNVFSACHPVLLLGLVMLVTIFLSDLINNTATALIMAPIAIDVARGTNLNIDTFLMAVAVGASCSFATPIGHQNNVIIYNIGKYKFGDYLKLGIPLESVVFAVAIPTLLYFWPIYG